MGPVSTIANSWQDYLECFLDYFWNAPNHWDLQFQGNHLNWAPYTWDTWLSGYIIIVMVLRAPSAQRGHKWHHKVITSLSSNCRVSPVCSASTLWILPLESHIITGTFTNSMMTQRHININLMIFGHKDARHGDKAAINSGLSHVAGHKDDRMKYLFHWIIFCEVCTI